MRSLLVLALLIGCAGPRSNTPTQQPTEASPATEPVAEGSASALPDEQEVLAEVPPTNAEAAQVCPHDEVPPATTTLAKEQFVQAEKFFQEKFMPYRIPSAPKTKREADNVLGTLVRLADEAQQSYLAIADVGGPLELAVRVRVGDIRFFQAHKIATIPIPQGVIAMAATQPNANLLITYAQAVEALVRPLEEQARRQWIAAIEKGKELCIANSWTVLATVRLARLDARDAPVMASTVPQCSAPNPTSTLASAPSSEFDKAEAFYQKTFATYRVKLVPRTTGEAYEFMGEVNLLAEQARVKFLEVARHRTGPPAIAAQLRAGDIAYHQAKTFLDIPAPKAIFDLDVPLPQNKRLIEYQHGVAQAAQALEDLARNHWQAAAREGQLQCIENQWTRLAAERLARPRL